MPGSYWETCPRSRRRATHARVREESAKGLATSRDVLRDGAPAAEIRTAYQRDLARGRRTATCWYVGIPTVDIVHALGGGNGLILVRSFDDRRGDAQATLADLLPSSNRPEAMQPDPDLSHQVARRIDSPPRRCAGANVSGRPRSRAAPE